MIKFEKNTKFGGKKISVLKEIGENGGSPGLAQADSKMSGEENFDPKMSFEQSTSSGSSSGLKVLSLNATKAGMEGLDTNKINAIVAEASKGSKFYEAKSKNQVRPVFLCQVPSSISLF